MHEGSKPPVPELETEARAAQLTVPALNGETANQRATAQPLLHVRASKAAGGYLLALNVARIQAAIAQTRSGLPKHGRRPPLLPTDNADDVIVWVGLCYERARQTPFSSGDFERLDEFMGKAPDCGEDWILWTLTLGG